MSLVAQLPCVVCEHAGMIQQGRSEVHHIAAGSGMRSDFGVVPLCAEHHRGATGIHGMGTRAFVRLHRPPGECEYGLLIWTAQEIERHLRDTNRIAA